MGSVQTHRGLGKKSRKKPGTWFIGRKKKQRGKCGKSGDYGFKGRIGEKGKLVQKAPHTSGEGRKPEGEKGDQAHLRSRSGGKDVGLSQ